MKATRRRRSGDSGAQDHIHTRAPLRPTAGFGSPPPRAGIAARPPAGWEAAAVCSAGCGQRAFSRFAPALAALALDGRDGLRARGAELSRRPRGYLTLQPARRRHSGETAQLLHRAGLEIAGTGAKKGESRAFAAAGRSAARLLALGQPGAELPAAGCPDEREGARAQQAKRPSCSAWCRSRTLRWRTRRELNPALARLSQSR